MPARFELDGVEFSPRTLESYPAFAALIGEIVTSFSLVEGMVGGIYGLIRHEEISDAISRLKKLPSNRTRVLAVREEIANSSELRPDPALDALMQDVLDYAERRNKIAHGVWGFHPDASDRLSRMPVKKWLLFVARLTASGTAGTILQEVDALKSFVEEYDLATLQNLKRDGAALLERLIKSHNLMAQAAARADGWEEHQIG